MYVLSNWWHDFSIPTLLRPSAHPTQSLYISNSPNHKMHLAIWHVRIMPESCRLWHSHWHLIPDPILIKGDTILYKCLKAHSTICICLYWCCAFQFCFLPFVQLGHARRYWTCGCTSHSRTRVRHCTLMQSKHASIYDISRHIPLQSGHHSEGYHLHLSL